MSSADMALPVAMLLVGLAYAGAILRIRARHGRVDIATTGRILAMAVALVVLGIALLSPLDELADQLLAAHMVQHLLLMLVAAPLLVWARPLPALSALLPRAAGPVLGRAWSRLLRTSCARRCGTPLFAGVLFCGTLLAWHLPAVYRWMLASEWRHASMHLAFLCAALVFWSIVLDPAGLHRVNRGGRIVLVMSTALISSLAGALLAFAPHTLYRAGALEPLPFGLTPLQDQQLAGLLMWIPMDLVLFGVAAALFCAWLDTPRRSMPGATHSP